MQAARNTIMKATEVCPKNEDVWLEAIRLQVIITNLKKEIHSNMLTLCSARLSGKNLGASWPPSFHFWSPEQVF